MTEITTETKRKKKLHKKFKQVIQFDSSPLELITEAGSTKTEIKKLSRSPYKFSFGKVRFPHGVAEAYIYVKNPSRIPDSILWSFSKDQFAKTECFVSDKRRTLEFYSLVSKIRYFLSLSRKRKLNYLQNKGFFASINTYKEHNS